MGSGIDASRLTGSLTTGPAPEPSSPFRSALIDLCFERGFDRLTVSDLCRRAGVPPVAFRRRHADLLDCFTHVADAELGRFHTRAESARAGLGVWRDRLRATTYAVYRYLDSDEALRRFLLIEARVVGERPALLLAAEFEALFDLIDEGRSEPTAPSTLTRATAESIGGSIFTQIYLAAAHGGPLTPEPEAVPPMMYAAVLPYLGVRSAAEELRIPPPPGAPEPAVS